MIEKIDKKQFEDGLVDLSAKSTNSGAGGNNQQLELNIDLTTALNELSKIKDNQQQL